MAKLRGKKWMVSLTLPDGTRLRPTFQTKDEAEKWERGAREAREAGKPIPPVPTAGADARASLRTLGGLYTFVARTEWAALKHPLTASRNGESVVKYFGANKPTEDVTSVDIAEMKAHFAEKGLTPSTVNKRVAAISKMLRVAANAGVINRVPVINWSRTVKTKFRYLDDQEERAMLAFFRAVGDPDMVDLCTLLVDTGARCYSEMLPVEWNAFGPGFSSVTFWNTKTNQPRTVPLTKRCREILERRQRGVKRRGPFRGADRVDPNDPQVLTMRTMRHRWDRLREGVEGFHDVTPHTLRHTCCTRLVLGGVDIKRVMTWMGHTSIATTMRYMQIKPTSLEEVVHVLEGAVHCHTSTQSR